MTKPIYTRQCLVCMLEFTTDNPNYVVCDKCADSDESKEPGDRGLLYSGNY